MLGSLADGVRGLGPGAFWLLAGGAGALAAAGFYFLWHGLRRARIIADTPTARIRSAPQGYVELAGTGKPYDGGPSVSPLTGRTCLWYRYRTEVRQGSGIAWGRRVGHPWAAGGAAWAALIRLVSEGRGDWRRWRTLQADESDAPFLLADDTDWCEVHPEGAEVTARERRIWCTRHSNPNGMRTSMQVGRFTLNFGGRYRHTEELLLPGPVYALGWFRTLSDAPPPINAAIRERLEHWQQAPEVFMAQFDANSDGRLDASERHRARALARSRVMAERAADGPGVTFHVLEQPAESGRPFLLAGQSSAGLEGHYRRRTLLALAGFVAGSAVLLWLLAARL